MAYVIRISHPADNGTVENKFVAFGFAKQRINRVVGLLVQLDGNDIFFAGPQNTIPIPRNDQDVYWNLPFTQSKHGGRYTLVVWNADNVLEFDASKAFTVRPPSLGIQISYPGNNAIVCPSYTSYGTSAAQQGTVMNGTISGVQATGSVDGSGNWQLTFFNVPPTGVGQTTSQSATNSVESPKSATGLQVQGGGDRCGTGG